MKNRWAISAPWGLSSVGCEIMISLPRGDATTVQPPLVVFNLQIFFGIASSNRVLNNSVLGKGIQRFGERAWQNRNMTLPEQFVGHFVKVIVVYRPRINLLRNSFKTCGYDPGKCKVGVGRPVYHTDFEPARSWYADHLRAVGSSIGDIDGSPGCSRARSAANQTFVTIHQRSDQRGKSAGVTQYAAHEPFPELRQPKIRRRILEQVLPCVYIGQTQMHVSTVAGEVAKWFGHERGQQAVLLCDSAH